MKGLLEKVKSALRHSALLARIWRRMMFRTTVIAITGSVGKTTARELLYHILKDVGPTHVTRNNENDLHGLPGVILRLRPWHRWAVIECAASGPGTLAPLARIVRPDIAIITAVASTHSRHYADLEHIAAEKAQLLRYLHPRGTAILNHDDLRVRDMATSLRQRVRFFGSNEECDTSATEIHARWPERLRLTVHLRDHPDIINLQTRLVGAHWLSSVLAATAAAHHLGISHSRIAQAISTMPPFRCRMEPIQLPSGAVAIRDHNASLHVLKAMLEVASTARCDRRVLVLGDTNDTGNMRSKLRKKYVGQLVAPHFEVAIFVGRSSYRSADSAIEAGMSANSVFAVETVLEADALLRREIRSGDLVFVKGQNVVHLDRILLTHFGHIECRLERCHIRADCDVCPYLKPAFDLKKALEPI